LRIAVFTRQFSPTGGGAERYSIALVGHLAPRHDIHVFAQHINPTVSGVTYHQVSQPFKRPRWLNQLWYATVTWWATRVGFDVVHSHENTWHGNVQTVHVLPIRFNLLNGLSGARLALRWLKILTSPRLLVYLALEGARYSLRQPRAIVVASETLVPQMLQVYPACRSAIEVITPGVHTVSGVATLLEKTEARKRLGLPEQGFCILFVGNDYRKKGLHTLLRALCELPKSSFVAVVGNAGQIPSFKAEAENLGLSDRVYFLGPLTDVTVAYQAANMLAHPTLEDTFAMVVLEATSHGLPVVVSEKQYCGIAALLTSETNALVLANPRDPRALAIALRRCLEDAGLTSRLSAEALEFAQKHQWDSLASVQERIYFKVALNAR
jgi:UDP-glucose:(heptosyl)LPS alpha-1,3-glucosyltransferase